ncbi:uncharacterized protein LOC124311479 isoform X2 [Daphnia pulicaria]|uniref:uncharacterized protein LOC124311479 isoform X2 n=1 Tax=Daphnia pulicaria TaxID=35523 RepID=UPI001EECC3BF|nr:uncharacterized protein LOC124311479 isoform X2 [Daphnia pulicaria]
MQFLRDLRTEPSIVTTQHEVFLVKVLTCQSNNFRINTSKIKNILGMQSNAFSIELRISLFHLSLNDLVYVHVNVGVFTRTPLFIPYPVWCGWNSSADGWRSNCRCLAVFPRHKGVNVTVENSRWGNLHDALVFKKNPEIPLNFL